MAARGIVALALLVLVGCADWSTQAGRRSALDGYVVRDLRATFDCEDEVRLVFVRTERRSGAYFDYYRAHGCGHEAGYVTRVTNGPGYVSWDHGVAPEEEAYRRAAEEQVQRVARFELECPGGVDLTLLDSSLDVMGREYNATIGGRGCGRSGSYNVVCRYNGYVDGVAEVECFGRTSVVSGEDGVR